MKIEKDRAIVYSTCEYCKTDIPHLHYYREEQSMKDMSEQEIFDDVKAKRIEYHETFGKYDFPKRTTNDFISDENIMEEVKEIIEAGKCRYKIDKCFCVDIREAPEYEWLV